MNLDLQNKIELEAKIGNTDGYGLHSFADEQRISEFKRGASFVQSILQTEIERLNKYKVQCDYTHNDYSILEEELSEAHATIQSLKDENKKEFDYGVDAACAFLSRVDSQGEMYANMIRNYLYPKALTHKAEE